MATTSCTLYSHKFNGDLIQGISQNWTGVGFLEIRLDLTGAGMSNAYSDYVVTCTIPGSLHGTVHGVDLDEQ
jgi:hypothetical protein